MAVEVLVTGGDTDLGRTMAEGFRNDGHKVTLVGARRGDLEVAAKELDVDAVVCDTTDPTSLTEARGLFPRHLDTIVNVPAPSWDAGDPRAYSVSDTANAWRNALDATVLSVVLTVANPWAITCAPAARLSAWWRRTRLPVAPSPRSKRPSRIGSRARPPFSARAGSPSYSRCGRSVQTGYEGLSEPANDCAEIARLALFLTTPAARHITGQTLHVSHGALAHFG
ncbi:short chain dehydrogenase [Mycobacterium tuberculosis CAS/NITR204]|uniref:Short chain dehydrogenase n=1 Tax=Mycobacterium tuberculosis CAS/NITR204 TaxID=1310114 RepID=R4M6J3_MYCTX|nr:short chain dehydrogenase [Mycobacterium tuberculosis CAS/NITR204]